MSIKRVNVFSKEDFKHWLEKNHDKENIVELVIHKKHTGKNFPSHMDLMHEGICFGWIDTVIRKIDEDRYIRTFQRRNDNSKWSVNTLSYGKKLIGEGRMTPPGLKFYKEGLKKKAFDHHVPKNPEVPKELLDMLKGKAEENFNNLPKSTKRSYMRWILLPKLQATKLKRMSHVANRMLEPDWRILKF